MPKCRLLSRAELDAARFASDDVTRYSLQTLHILPDKVVATDGHYLVVIPNNGMPPEDFPEVSGMVGEAPAGPVNIPAKVALDTLKSIPKTQIPILNNAALTAHNGSVQLTTTDLDSPRMATAKREDNPFPSYEKVIPKDEPKLNISFDAKYLKTICEYAAKHSGSKKTVIRFDLTNTDNPAKITFRLEDGREALVVLMPCKL